MKADGGIVQSVAQHLLRTPDGSVYGPVGVATLCTWAADARVIPGCALSTDGKTWRPVETFPEIRLNWSVKFDDGNVYGPLNLLAIWVLAAEKSIPHGVSLIEAKTNRTVILDESLYPLLIEECRQILAGCGKLMNETIASLARAQAEGLSQLSGRDTLVAELKSRLEQADGLNDQLKLKLAKAESDLSVNLKLVSETQRQMAGYAAQASAGSGENEALGRSLATARKALAERESQLESLTGRVGQVEGELKTERLAAAELRSALSRQEQESDKARKAGEDLARTVSERESRLAERDSLISELKLQLAKTGSDLEINVKLVADAQRQVAEYAALAAMAGAGSQEKEALCRSLASVRVDLAERESQLDALKTKASLLESDLKAELAKAITELQAERLRLEEKSGRAVKTGEELVTVKASLAEQEQALAGLREELAQQSHAKDQAEEARVTAVSLVAERDRTITELQVGRLRQEEELAKSAKTGAELALRVREETSRADRAGEACAAAVSLVAERDRMITELQAERARQEEELDKAAKVVEELATAKTTLVEQEQALAGLREELARQEHAKDQAEKAHVEAVSLVAERDRTITGLQTERSRMESELEQKLVESRTAAARLAEEIQEKDRLLGELETVRAQWDKTNQDLAAAHKTGADLAQRLHDLLVDAKAKDNRIFRMEAEAEDLSRKMKEVQAELQRKESVISGQETSIATLKVEADRALAGMRSKHAFLEKELQLSRLSEKSMVLKVNQAKESAARVLKSSHAAKQKLREEVASLKADLNGLIMASQCAKQASSAPAPDPIDWMGGVSPVPSVTGDEADIQARFPNLPMSEKVGVIQKEMIASADQKEALRRELESLKARHEALGTESARQAKEFRDQLEQFQKETRTASDLLAKAMQEVENRETQLRDMRKKTAAAVKPEPREKPAVLEAEVIHSENLGRDEATGHGGTGASAGGVPPTPPPPGTPPSAGRILNSVEAQLQRELKKWETMKREKDKKEGTLSKWFRRKSS